MGGKVYDRKPLVVDRDPSKTLAVEVGKFAKPNPVDLALAFGNALLDYGLDAFKNVTGIDLKSWTSFLDALPGFDAGKIISGIFSGGLIPGLDASKIVSGVFNTVVIPFLDAGKIISGIFSGGLIPGLDASKIVSGQFPQSIISGLTGLLSAFPGANIVGSIASSLLSGVLGSGLIPGLDASKITSGSFPQAMVTGLTSFLSAIPGANIVGSIASSLLSGVLGSGLIPGLDASKITSGSFPQSMVSGLVGLLNAFPGGNIIGSIASSLLSGVLGAGLIPGLDASKITSGSFPQAMVNITSIASNLLSGAINAAIIPALDASKIVTGVFHQSMVNITNIASGIVSGIFGAGQIPALDASKITSGTFAQSQVAGLPAGLSDLGAGIQGAVNGIVNSLQGAAGAFWTQADANAALSSQAAATAAAAAALAQIQAGQNNNNNGGLNAIVDFSTFPDSTNLPSIFTQTYIGGSALPAGAFGVADGKAGTVNNEASFAVKTIIGEYNVADTVTDYQRVSAVWANAPGYSYQNPTPFYTPLPFYNPYRADSTILVRFKDVNNWTQFRFLSANQIDPGVCILETCVAGVVTELTRIRHGFQPSTNYVFDAGTPSSLMQFRVTCGAKVVMAYTDSAAVSQVGPLFRSASMGGTEYGAQGAGVPANPARLLYFALQDNSPAGVIGSGARFYRGLTAGVAGAANALIPNNTLNETEYRTDDYIWAPASNCRVTVAKTDWYIVSARMAYSAASGAAVRLYRNGVIARTSSGSNSVFGNVITSVMYLQAGDFVQVGLTANATIVGSAGGADTYLEITRVGKAT